MKIVREKIPCQYLSIEPGTLLMSKHTNHMATIASFQPLMNNIIFHTSK